MGSYIKVKYCDNVDWVGVRCLIDFYIFTEEEVFLTKGCMRCTNPDQQLIHQSP